MTEALLSLIRNTTPSDLSEHLKDVFNDLESGCYDQVLKLSLVQNLLHGDSYGQDDGSGWTAWISARIIQILQDDGEGSAGISSSPEYNTHILLLIAVASLSAFIQSNVSGPPLYYSSAALLIPARITSSASRLAAFRKGLVASLSQDGIAAYALVPNVELFCFAQVILDTPAICETNEYAKWLRLRVQFLHQRLLSETAPSLEAAIYPTLEDLAQKLLRVDTAQASNVDTVSTFLLERATINIYHGHDKEARQDIEEAVRRRGFEFALTGQLGKRTKFQERDISQLVVLAKSSAAQDVSGDAARDNTKSPRGKEAKPENLDLNDDTLLESISFTRTPSSITDVHAEANLPASLRALDPADQPILSPLDSIALLSLASSIKNTSPEDGLTREETLPYATRVLSGGSSNWQIYTQALLVRSRIEGYRSRTMERGLLQLQALVDQVVAETASPHGDAVASTTRSNGDASDESVQAATTFLPRAKASESAPVQDRLLYVYALASPTRWEIEAELAARWVSMGGLRSALEIYTRLQMWPEVALCWAATERDDKARRIVRRLLFHATDGKQGEDVDEDTEEWGGEVREPAPAGAPRLYCILGDIDKDPDMYQRAWKVSGSRYARAQRSLGKFFFGKKAYRESAEAYEKSLKVNQLNGSSWFALGCAWLELSEFRKAVEVFTRTVQLDDSDAEAWSNLAAALLSINRSEAREQSNGNGLPTNHTTGMRDVEDDEDGVEAHKLEAIEQRQKRTKDALVALKQASRLKFDNFRILDNLLTVAASTVPPSYDDLVSAQRRLIDLRGGTDGEKCVDVRILDGIVRHVIELDTENKGYNPSKPGLTRMVVDLVDKKVVPLITASSELWHIVARLALWRRKPSFALDAHEKAWRAVIAQPGWEHGSEDRWNGVVTATGDLVNAYESLGELKRTEGLAGGSEEVVMRDWRFKARSVVRGILGRAKDSWEDTKGWNDLQTMLQSLKS